MRFAFVLLLTMLVATCGQKGPLELPPEPRSLALVAMCPVPG